MLYMMICCTQESGVIQSPREHSEMADFQAFYEELERSGSCRADHRLRPSGEARTVHVRDDGEVELGTGSFTGSELQMGGFYLVECDNFDEVVALASKHPVSRGGVMEIRPVWERQVVSGAASGLGTTTVMRNASGSVTKT